MLQVHWAGVRSQKSDSGVGPSPRLGGLCVPLYEEPKQIKFLASSLLSAKLAFVLSAASKSALALQRTILFGDAAPPFGAQPSIEGEPGDTRFYLKIPHNTEQLSVQLPPEVEIPGMKLFVIKSLPSGVLVYDDYEYPRPEKV